MSLPISRSALDKLGGRLVASDGAISDPDYESLEAVLEAYQTALDEAQEILQSIGYAPTTRVKSTGTLIEKLAREHGMKLKGVQDVAGARIVVSGSRLDQDRIVEQVGQSFPDEQRPPRTFDRRVTPSFGYRAVHVVVHHDSIPIEIQVRTQLQDLWAQIIEKLGDTWGRGIRYGEPLTQPELPVLPGIGITRQDFLGTCLDLSDEVARLEEVQVELREVTHLLAQDPASVPDSDQQSRLEAVKVRLIEAEDHLVERLSNLVRLVQAMEGP